MKKKIFFKRSASIELGGTFGESEPTYYDSSEFAFFFLFSGLCGIVIFIFKEITIIVQKMREFFFICQNLYLFFRNILSKFRN